MGCFRPELLFVGFVWGVQRELIIYFWWWFSQPIQLELHFLKVNKSLFRPIFMGELLVLGRLKLRNRWTKLMYIVLNDRLRDG